MTKFLDPKLATSKTSRKKRMQVEDNPDEAAALRIADIVHDPRGADVEEAVGRRHDRREQPGDDDACQQRMRTRRLDYGRCGISSGELRVRSL